MSKLTYYKLGEGKNYFFDPTTRLEVMPNKITPVSTTSASSKKFKRAKNNGHIVQVTEEEYNKSLKASKETKSSKEEELTDERLERDDLKAMKRAKLDEYATKQMVGHMTAEEIEDLSSKDVVIETLIEFWDEQDEEEDDEE